MSWTVRTEQFGDHDEAEVEGATIGEAVAAALGELGLDELDEAGGLVIRVSGDSGVSAPAVERERKPGR